MSERTRESRPRALLRFVGIIVAFGLTIVAAWMIALGHSQREVSLGVIAGLWAALIGAMAFYSGRHSGHLSSAGGTGGSEVELRQDFALELQREVSARRAYEQQLHEMVRREIETIQRVVGDQLGKLRDDVATLRGDLVDQVGGKIRLERIETTRVIGSDIEALQNEVRQLAGTRMGEDTNRRADTPRRVVDASSTESSEPSVAIGRPGSIRTSSDSVKPTPAPSPVAAAPPAPQRPAYQPYIAPTYAPAVTYSAGLAGDAVPQYSAPAAAIDPVEPRSVESRSVESRPVESRPVESRPVESRPVESSSVDRSAEEPADQPASRAHRIGPDPGAGPYQLPPRQPLPAMEPLTSQPAVQPAAPPVPTFTPIGALPSLELPGLAPLGSSGSTSGAPANGSGHGADPFAGLPRLAHFDDIDDAGSTPPASDWRSPQTTAQPWSPPAGANASPVEATYGVPANGAAQSSTYGAPTYGVPPNGTSANGESTYGAAGTGRRHGAADDAPPAPAAAAETGGGRRRRAEGETNEVLARLLGDH